MPNFFVVFIIVFLALWDVTVIIINELQLFKVQLFNLKKYYVTLGKDYRIYMFLNKNVNPIIWDEKEKKDFFSRRIIPAFHYSNIPLFQYSIAAPFTPLESPGIYSGDDIINRVSSLLRAG